MDQLFAASEQKFALALTYDTELYICVRIVRKPSCMIVYMEDIHQSGKYVWSGSRGGNQAASYYNPSNNFVKIN